MLAPVTEHVVQQWGATTVARLDCERNETDLKMLLPFSPFRLLPGWSFADEGSC
jgi:hypothetical protein